MAGEVSLGPGAGRGCWPCDAGMKKVQAFAEAWPFCWRTAALTSPTPRPAAPGRFCRAFFITAFHVRLVRALQLRRRGGRVRHVPRWADQVLAQLDALEPVRGASRCSSGMNHSYSGISSSQRPALARLKERLAFAWEGVGHARDLDLRAHRHALDHHVVQARRTARSFGRPPCCGCR